MTTLGLFVEYAAVICLCLVISATLFFFLVEWLVTSPSQAVQARVIELPAHHYFRNDKAA